MTNLVVKDNALIEASHKLSEAEHRLVLLAIIEARKHCDSVEELRGKELIIHASDYAKTYRISVDMAYVSLKKAVVNLYRAEWGYKYINDRGNKVVRYERFTQSAMYIEGEGVVSFRFADAIIPMLVELEKRFTAYEIEQVAQLSSRYAMRLYEFFMQYLDKNEGKGWLEISLDNLRFRFGLLSSEYKTMSNFKAYVLDFALKQINERTDLSATYTQTKRGRTITGFRFEFKKKFAEKKQKIEQKEVKKSHGWQEKGLSDAQINKIKINAQTFCDSNSDLMPSTFGGTYNDLMEYWRNDLKNPSKVNKFVKIQELLDL